MAEQLRIQADVFFLKMPKGKTEHHYFDEGKPRDRKIGLSLRLRDTGSRQWFYHDRFAGKTFKVSLGSADKVTLAEARDLAQKQHDLLRAGQHPVLVKRAQEEELRRKLAEPKPLTLLALINDYLAHRQPRLKPRTYVECHRHLHRDWKPLHALPASDVKHEHIASQLPVIERFSGAISANRARGTLSTMYRWAIGGAYGITSNPVVNTRRMEGEKARDRVLSDTELATIWKALPDNAYGRIVKLLTLTGQRRDEIGSLHWSEINLPDRLITLPGERTKNHRTHDVPLSDTAVAVLESTPRRHGRDLVFGEGKGGYAGWSRSKDSLDKATAINEPWTLHDLRRTAATRMADLGVQPHVIEAVLNHISGHKAGVAGIYNRSTYAKEKRAALDLWAGHIKLILVQSEGANVRRIKRTG